MILIVIALAGTLAREPQLPPGITCEQVRSYVKDYGYAVAFAWALREGYSLAQIREAKKCLR